MRLARTRLTRGALALAALTLLSGCALRQDPQRTGPFIRPGEPAVDLGERPRVARPTLEEFMQEVRRLTEQARPPRPASTVVSAEASDPALSAALVLLRIAPTPANHRRVADAYLRLGIRDAAHRHLSVAIAQDPRDAAAYDGRARIWRDWGFGHVAVGDAVRAVYFAPDSPIAHNTLGTILLGLGDRPQARAAYTRALALEPAASYALNNLCYLLFLEGRRAGATAACRAALAAQPALAAAQNNLALVHASQGRLDEAAAGFERAAGEAAARYNIGIVLLAQRKFDRAARAFDEAARLAPGLARARVRARQARLLAAGAAAPGSHERH